MASKVGKSLALRGFLPRDLPPVFTSSDFGNNYSHLLGVIPEASRNKWTAYEPYSMPRAKSGRRVAAIVNPVPFMGLSDAIAKNWVAIRKLHKRSKISYSAPIFNSKVRALKENDFRGYRDCQVIDSSGFSFVLHADFSRFFPTIYTHAIEWAVHTKAISKASLRSKSPALWGKKLDEYSRCMQEGQTQGIPIGPDTSYILAELVASAIDEFLQKKLKGKIFGGRIIDDYVLFFETRNEAEKALGFLAQACREFQVELNPEKTTILEIKDESRESWTYKLGDYEPQQGISQQRRAITRYTDQTVSLFAQNGSSSVGRYAIKVLSSEVIHPKNIDIAFSCVMRLSRLSPNALSDVVRLFVSYHQLGFKYDRAAITRFLVSGLDNAIDLGHISEASWFLWASLELKIKLPASIVKRISQSDSSPVLLLGKALELAKLLPSKITQKVLPANLAALDFESQHWLLAYEGAMQGWFGWTRANIVGSKLEPLSNRNIHFLDLQSGSAIVKRKEVKNPLRKLELEGINIEDLDFDDLEDLYEAEVEEDGYDFIVEEEEEEEERYGDFD